MRSGYSDESDQKDLAMWRGRVASSIRGKRGQALLRDCLVAMDAMPLNRLIKEELVYGDDVCLLGAVGRKRGLLNLEKIDPGEHGIIGERLNIASCLVQEIEYINDEAGPCFDACGNRCKETPEERFTRVRKWVEKKITAAK